MSIRCLAIDDEPLALQQIGAYIDKTPFLERVALCQSAFDAMQYLAGNSVDLMFVDINMPDLNGMDFVKSLSQKPQVIFTTAYSEYAIEGFKVDALDYILKPISYTVFLKSATKAKGWFDAVSQIVDATPVVPKDSIFVKSESKLIRIAFADIEYIESSNEYIQIHVVNEKPISTLLRLKGIEEELPKDSFMRIHRSFIINLKRIKMVDRNRVVFDNKTFIPIGDQYKDAFQAYIDRTFI